jgi:hypothetical protein
MMVKRYEELNVFFTEEGWFNATSVAKKFAKQPADWLKTEQVKELILEISNALHCLDEQNQLVKVRRGAPETGGGTWMHPKLAIHFAYWLSPKFAVWVGNQIEIIIRSDLRDTMSDPFPTLVHPIYGFPIVSLLEDNIHKQVRNTYIETLNRLGLNAPIYKQTLTNNVNRILVGMPVKPFRRLFGIPAGSHIRTRLFMDYNLRRAISRIEETACFMINSDHSVTTFEQVELVVYSVARIIYNQHLSRGVSLNENIPEGLLEVLA